MKNKVILFLSFPKRKHWDGSERAKIETTLKVDIRNMSSVNYDRNQNWRQISI